MGVYSLRFLKSKKGLALVVAVVAVAASAVAAYAFFTAAGSGTATAGTGGPTALTVNQVGSITGLLPGGPAAPVDFSIHNPTAGDEGFGDVIVTVTGTTAGAACPASNFKVNQAWKSGPTELDAGQTYNSTTDPGPHSGTTVQMIETGASQDGCEGTTVNLAFTINP
jgi:hypothetical protein